MGLGWGARARRWFHAPVERTAARRPCAAALWVIGLTALAAGCSSRPYGSLIVGPTAPDAHQVDLFVATTRAPVIEPPGVMFGGSRGRGLDFADIVVSIPPDGARQAGRHPDRRPRRPAIRSMISSSCAPTAWTWLRRKRTSTRAIRRTPGRRVLVFVHGFNTRFEEAVYRFAQIVHDARVNVAPVLFTWPSGGNVTDYVYDRDSAVYSRDALEVVLQALANDPAVDSISILAHSMGNYLVVEALRQMSIRDRGLPPKIRDVMMASPDIDIDVFRRQIAEIDAGPRPAQFTLFVSRDDRALRLSSFLARDSTRLGALDPTKEPYRSILEKGRVQVIDLTSFASNDFTNHSRFASGEVVGRDRRPPGGGPDRLPKPRRGWSNRSARSPAGAITVAAGVATGAVKAPAQIVDPTTHEKSVDTAAGAASLGQ